MRTRTCALTILALGTTLTLGQEPGEPASLLDGVAGVDSRLLGTDVFASTHADGSAGRVVVEVQRADDGEVADGMYQVAISVRGPTGRGVRRTVADARFAVLRAGADGGVGVERMDSFWWVTRDAITEPGPEAGPPHHHDLGALYLLSRRLGPGRAGRLGLHGLTLGDEGFVDVSGELSIPEGWTALDPASQVSVRSVRYAVGRGRELVLHVDREGRLRELTSSMPDVTGDVTELVWLRRETPESAAAARQAALELLARANDVSAAGDHAASTAALTSARLALDELPDDPSLERAYVAGRLRANARAAAVYALDRDASYLTPAERERLGAHHGHRAVARVLWAATLDTVIRSEEEDRDALLADPVLEPVTRIPMLRTTRWLLWGQPRDVVWGPGAAVATGVPEFERLWTERAAAELSRADHPATRAWIWETSEAMKKRDDVSPAEHWRNLLMYGLLDPRRHGGWPYRAQSLFDERLVGGLFASVLEAYEQSPTDFNAYALVTPAVAARRYDLARELVRQLRGSNRLLCDLALSNTTSLMGSLAQVRGQEPAFAELFDELFEELGTPAGS